MRCNRCLAPLFFTWVVAACDATQVGAWPPEPGAGTRDDRDVQRPAPRDDDSAALDADSSGHGDSASESQGETDAHALNETTSDSRSATDAGESSPPVVNCTRAAQSFATCPIGFHCAAPPGRAPTCYGPDGVSDVPGGCAATSCPMGFYCVDEGGWNHGPLRCVASPR